MTKRGDRSAHAEVHRTAIRRAKQILIDWGNEGCPENTPRKPLILAASRLLERVEKEEAIDWSTIYPAATRAASSSSSSNQEPSIAQ